ncbi:hypothetical protein TTHERM_000414389 (macronuclear) [Tetrahymena thermophila SB210]|uniref:Uncharacterized protein n=1 Tax=Tetrahymena thermophila (strain SB210) TaxID=312017 RepID=W7XFH8_TETTS|nr:hypothetical protein TTHERM_000414389 [Tetrahymena thermophila SB210]EWS76592.1 hypothetical protein TTHERM_000414389 [Tetrahymena thermophila SB210]|eukprot:XP_012650878.1 hypothetical protein TTHERM_000414389 [Tetrahymena thermophila SB210]
MIEIYWLKINKEQIPQKFSNRNSKDVQSSFKYALWLNLLRITVSNLQDNLVMKTANSSKKHF